LLEERSLRVDDAVGLDEYEAARVDHQFGNGRLVEPFANWFQLGSEDFEGFVWI